MTQGIRKRGKSYEIAYEIGQYLCQRCVDCRRRYWIDSKRLQSCPSCGGRLLESLERRQEFRGGFPTRRQAERARIEALATKNNGIRIPATRYTLKDYLLDEWLPARKPRTGRQGRGHRGQVSLGTWAAYRSTLVAYVIPRLGHLPLQELTAANLHCLYDDLEESGGRRGQGLSSKTVLNVHRVMHKAMSDAVKTGKVARNVLDSVQAPAAGRPRTEVWNVDQLRSFLDHVQQDRLYAAWLLLATTGMRRGEVVGLAWEDLNLEVGRLRVAWTLGVVDSHPTWKPTPKSRAGERTMALDPATVDALRAHRSGQAQERLRLGAGWPRRQVDWRGEHREDLVFTWPDGSLINPERFSRWFRQHCIGAGLPRIRLHDVRHTYATAGLTAATGWHDVKIMSERLGHANVGITLDTYSHVLPVADEQAAHTLARVILGS
jgi:integrase